MEAKGKLARDSAAIASALLQSGADRHPGPVRIYAMRRGETQEQAKARVEAFKAKHP